MPGVKCKPHGIRTDRCKICHPEKYYCSHQKRRDACKKCKEEKLAAVKECDSLFDYSSSEDERISTLQFESEPIESEPFSCGMRICHHGELRQTCKACAQRMCPHGNFEVSCPIKPD
jgi:hypothetical protein